MDNISTVLYIWHYNAISFLYYRSSSQSKRSKSKSKKDIKASLKTVSELAKLVTSGAVQVPKSLVNYTTDKALLLDQVFTILSPNDVNGMLPDILKVCR